MVISLQIIVFSSHSVADRNNLQSAKVGYCNNNQYAVYCRPSCGPTFGGGHDLYCRNDGTWYSNNPASYSKVDIPNGDFGVSDYEVFQVVKN